MTTTRDQIIQTTSDLLENQGYHATGMSEIVKASGAPKGSIYYYFPKGKEEITSEAVLFAGRMVAERIRVHLANGMDVADAIQTFVETIAHHVEASGFHAGGPLTIVASETATTSERLNLACRASYGLLIDAFKTGLVSHGVAPERATSLAMIVTTSIEGGIILSRTYHTGDPLRQVARELACMLRSCGQ
jgi:TetR/AcrR family transcriptional repressor of lmrAB and yxaGH operons